MWFHENPLDQDILFPVMTLTLKYDRPNVHYCFIGTGPSLPEEMRVSSGQKCPEINIDYIGNSLNNKINKKETWQECGKWCRDTPGCNYWTWTPPGSAYPKWCFLKTARASRLLRDSHLDLKIETLKENSHLILDLDSQLFSENSHSHSQLSKIF